MATKLSELASKLDDIEKVLEKVQTEVQALIDALKNVEIPADAQASLDKLAAIAKTIDDLNPDAT